MHVPFGTPVHTPFENRSSKTLPIEKGMKYSSSSQTSFFQL